MDLSISGASDCLTIYMLHLTLKVSLKNTPRMIWYTKLFVAYLQPFAILAAIKDTFHQQFYLAIITVKSRHKNIYGL